MACLGYGVDEVLCAVGKPFDSFEAQGSDGKSSEAKGVCKVGDVRDQLAMV